MGSRESFICHIILKDGLKIHAYRNTFVYLYTLIIKAKEFLVGPSVFTPDFQEKLQSIPPLSQKRFATEKRNPHDACSPRDSIRCQIPCAARFLAAGRCGTSLDTTRHLILTPPPGILGAPSLLFNAARGTNTRTRARS
jgi:hypothetical protein